MQRQQPDSVRSAAAAFIRAEAVGVHAIADRVDADPTFAAVTRLLAGAAGRLIVSGVGTSGFIARRAAHLFSVSGTPAFFLHPTEALHGSLGAVQPGDVLIAISKGGGSAEINELVRRAKRAGISAVAITAGADNDLARLVDIAVVLPFEPTADPGQTIAMGSTLAHAAWLDAQAYVLMRIKRYRWDAVLETHPGGAVGQITDLPAELDPLELSDGELS